MKPQATKCTQKQLAYLAYWQSRGHKFGRNDVILESTAISPLNQCHIAEFIVSGIAIVGCIIWMAVR